MKALLKNVIHRISRNTKIIGNFSMKKKAKKIYCSNKFPKCTIDVKKHETLRKDIIEKSKIESTNLPSKLTINKVDVYNKP